MREVQILYARSVATLSVGTGKRATALTTQGWTELAEAARTLAADIELRAVVVAGAAAGGFCSGSNVHEWFGASPVEVDASFAAMETALRAVERIPMPVVAAIRGVAAGAGCQLACACDVRVIAADAKIGMPVARWGILVPPCFAARLAAITGPGRARELLFTGRLVDAGEAVRISLASTSLPGAVLDAHLTSLLHTITSLPPTAVRAAKTAVDRVQRPKRLDVDLLTAATADHTAMQDRLAGFSAR